VVSLCSVFFKIENIHSFDIRYSLFDKLRKAGVSYSIKLAIPVASGGADTRNLKF
jgi:hypothetical protein